VVAERKRGAQPCVAQLAASSSREGTAPTGEVPTGTSQGVSLTLHLLVELFFQKSICSPPEATSCALTADSCMSSSWHSRTHSCGARVQVARLGHTPYLCVRLFYQKLSIYPSIIPNAHFAESARAETVKIVYTPANGYEFFKSLCP
jgi:hypothetical protein